MSTIAGRVVKVCASSGSTVAGVRAVATDISAPLWLSSEIILAEVFVTLAEGSSRVPSRSVMKIWSLKSSSDGFRLVNMYLLFA